MTQHGKNLFIGGAATALGAVLILAAIVVARAETPRTETVDGDRIVIIDGDTVALPCLRADCTGAERIRILNIDTPETTRATCMAEEKRGYEAKAALGSLIRGRSVTIARCEETTGRCKDSFGRTLARLAIPCPAPGAPTALTLCDIGQTLIEQGHALRWQPGPEAKRERQALWCGR